MSHEKSFEKGRGAQINPTNRFSKQEDGEWFDDIQDEEERFEKRKTKFIDVYPKTIVNHVKSPDVPDYSMNPYQGCEHGCIYCFARNSHEYWGYSAGQDFEQVILVKRNAPELLEKKLASRSWKAHPIVLSGNTDCYQPIERKLKITRETLKVFLKYKHPVGLITKNSLILRDLDLLKPLAQQNLVRVVISLTTLKEETRRLLEPRTASVNQKLKTIKTLSENGIPVTAMMGPIIPSINSHEILALAKAASQHGAISFSHTLVRLNGAIGEIFENWVHQTYPDRATKILNQIKACHGGKLNDSRYGTRMRGEGNIAKNISDMVQLAKLRYFANKPTFEYDFSKYTKTPDDNQLRLF